MTKKKTKQIDFTEAIWLISTGCTLYRETRPHRIFKKNSDGDIELKSFGVITPVEFPNEDVSAKDWLIKE